MIYQTDSASLEQTEALARKLGLRLRGGEVIALQSDLGGGKTAFVRGLAEGMGSSDHVASPTFTISRQYKATVRGLTMYHFDFYRLHEPGVIAAELAEYIGDPQAVVVIEWGEIVNQVIPEQHLNITIISTGDSSRNFTFSYPKALQYLVPAENIS